MKEKPVLVFDLVGTLLDLSGLDPLFRSGFAAARQRREWFLEVLKIALATTAAGDWTEFSAVAEAALKVVEQRQEKRLSWLQRRRILNGLHRLPAFGDVSDGLRQLAADGYRMAVLTNSSAKSAKESLSRTGLSDLFDKVLSADRVKRLKPAIEPYRMAVKELGVKPGRVLFVAAHAWDIRGAHRAGFRTCFVQRPEQVLDELTPQPDIIVPDLVSLAAAVRS
jgi:2-haloacid dehalogenase